jgi:hypothetical protein
MDIEGNELNALKGAIKTLHLGIVKNFIIEITPKFNNDGYQILHILKQNNYIIYNIPQIGIQNLNNLHFLDKIKTNPITNLDSFIKTIDIQTDILAIYSDEH